MRADGQGRGDPDLYCGICHSDVYQCQDDLAGAAPLLCAGITTWSPLRRWGVTEGKKAGIVGLGGLGHMGVKFAQDPEST